MSDEFKKQAIDQFDKWSDTYDDPGFFQRHLFIPTEAHIIRQLCSLEQPDSSFRMLDIGCGTGKLVWKVAEKFSNASFAGVDISSGMISMASEKTKGETRFQFLLGNAVERLPFDDASFDYLSCCHSFHHYPDQTAAAREFERVLKPNGKLFFVDSYINSAWGFFMHCVIIQTYEKFQVHHFWKKRLRRFFEGLGFQVERQDVVRGMVPWMMTVAVRNQEAANRLMPQGESK